MADQQTFSLALDKTLGGSPSSVDLTFCITKLDENEWDCFLTTIAQAGKPMADGLEISLAPADPSFQSAQTWTLQKPKRVTTEVEEENEVTLSVQAVVLETFPAGEPRAKITLGESTLATANWPDSG